MLRLRQACALLTLAAFAVGMVGLPANVRFRPPGDGRDVAAHSTAAAAQRAPANVVAVDAAAGDAADADEAPAEAVVNTGGEGRGCCCPRHLQVTGRCCCCAKSLAVGPATGCCSAKRADGDHSAALSQRRPAGPSSDGGKNGIWSECSCGTYSATLLFVCGEPRLSGQAVRLQDRPALCYGVAQAPVRPPFRCLTPETPPPRPAGC